MRSTSSSISSVGLCETINARSTTFSSSRIFPGQLYDSSRARDLAEIPVTCLPILAAALSAR